MTYVILVAVNDSAAGLAAADTAIDLAGRLSAELHAVTVVEQPSSELATDTASAASFEARRLKDADAMLAHVVHRGARLGVTIQTRRRGGHVAEEILAEASELGAGLLVLDLVDRPSHAMPYVGSQTLRVLEFSTIPVVVVPAVAARK